MGHWDLTTNALYRDSIDVYTTLFYYKLKLYI